VARFRGEGAPSAAFEPAGLATPSGTPARQLGSTFGPRPLLERPWHIRSANWVFETPAVLQCGDRGSA
jgi:hypothetical protein